MKKRKKTNKHIRTKPAARLEIPITPLSEGSQGRRGEGSQAESCGKNPEGLEATHKNDMSWRNLSRNDYYDIRDDRRWQPCAAAIWPASERPAKTDKVLGIAAMMPCNAGTHS